MQVRCCLLSVFAQQAATTSELLQQEVADLHSLRVKEGVDA
ncbi:protein of unknown function (plasmid) [Methylocella tundrae]|uniref:Uncharacterized protein n=1 Tax=Methylocella tundrae TaxID=227605 RepID=A0A4U8Z981_METTU|nr:protein of unknown function [Methylocella tundrae]